MKATLPLRTALFANAVFSTICGLIMFACPEFFGTLIGLQALLVFRLIGCGLLLFAADLLHQATRPRLETWRALYASGADFLWVISSLLGLLLFSRLFSETGVAVVLAVAGVVPIFGVWQMWGIDRAHRAENPALHRHCLVVHAEATPVNMWEVISRLGAIQKYSPSLVKSEILNGKAPGIGAVRRCADQSWQVLVRRVCCL
ncbi:hypothetical protein KR51_00017970 [Rubidibacter lacunae KORDI 51-2]|uniref:Uncharacterized protein n=1 Tax=Rubidibacter lacunae KORDI 51-2 TaxID=582515 RepID=U5DAI5_9CHRO|nr:hypothetical protein KR51_00017970 [Rubidibacter lacunae KORDI 51-2]